MGEDTKIQDKKLQKVTDIEDTEQNIVKKVCKELGITQKELAEMIGMSEGGLRSALSLGKITLQVKKSCELLLKINDLEKELQNYKILQNSIKTMIHPIKYK